MAYLLALHELMKEFDVGVKEGYIIKPQSKCTIYFYVINQRAYCKILTPGKLTRRSDWLMKRLPDGELHSHFLLTTEEVTQLVKKVKYMDLLRMEIPIPQTPSPPNELLKKCAGELRGLMRSLSRGNYRGALSICRNILMNYLLPPPEKKLKAELIEAVISKVPGIPLKKYRSILRGVEHTLQANLQHVHKFIKEDTGGLLTMPLKEDSEYIFTMPSNAIRYRSQLMMIT